MDIQFIRLIKSAYDMVWFPKWVHQNKSEFGINI